MNQINELSVGEDKDGNLFLTFDPDLLCQMGWHEGDTLEWSVCDDGSVMIEKKVEENE